MVLMARRVMSNRGKVPGLKYRLTWMEAEHDRAALCGSAAARGNVHSSERQDIHAKQQRRWLAASIEGRLWLRQSHERQVLVQGISPFGAHRAIRKPHRTKILQPKSGPRFCKVLHLLTSVRGPQRRNVAMQHFVRFIDVLRTRFAYFGSLSGFDGYRLCRRPKRCD